MFKPDSNTNKQVRTSVSDPDRDCIRIQLGHWIRIQIGDLDPEPETDREPGYGSRQDSGHKARTKYSHGHIGDVTCQKMKTIKIFLF